MDEWKSNEDEEEHRPIKDTYRGMIDRMSVDTCLFCWVLLNKENILTITIAHSIQNKFLRINFFGKIDLTHLMESVSVT